LVLDLTRNEKDRLRDHVAHKFPTAAFARIEFPVDRWKDVAPRSGKIAALILPKELD
jgi:phosphohistidine phosphatase